MAIQQPDNHSETKSNEALARVLLAEDDKAMRELLMVALEAEGYEVTECTHGGGLVNRLLPLYEGQKMEYDLILTDIRMPGLSGIEILEGMQDLDVIPPIILITAFGDRETHALAECYGAAAVLDKPFEMKDLLAKIREVLPSRRAH